MTFLWHGWMIIASSLVFSLVIGFALGRRAGCDSNSFFLSGRNLPQVGGYVAQRMLAARSERDATGSVLLFRLAHYAIRPWPWIVVALRASAPSSLKMRV